jgi:7-cyano-7-deazaguanine reductase
MNNHDHGPLGQRVAYASRHDASLLFPIARSLGRAELGITGPLPFDGVDGWNAYELSWLDARGKPQVALCEFRVPATSPNIIESKSFKLYLNSLNQERIASPAALRALLVRDLSAAAAAPVGVELIVPARFAELSLCELEGQTIDALDIAIEDYGPPNADHLHSAGDVLEEVLVSDLLKSNCPVTGQPDWASVQLRYRGARIDRAGLLRYLVSFREHAGFHEQCVERIFVDVMRRCAPLALEVHARYTRRGGLDINPWRGTTGRVPQNPRGARQ